MKSPAISSPPPLLLFLAFFFSSFLFFSSAADRTDGASELVSREFFPMEGDLAWIIQVSDLHLSAYDPKRAEDLVGLLGSAIRVIKPDLLLVTGDITDAKNRKRTSTRQDESEWIQYRNTMDALVKQSGLERRRIFDIRGNHDKYGVPFVGSTLDFFSVHSISSQFNRLGTLQSISLVGEDQRYIFLGIDDTMRTGLRGPSNLFGHPSANRIHTVEAELQYWDNHPVSFVTKVVFGHFPMSFTASAETGERYEPVFARHSISAYICGHLHSKFGKQLWRLHTFEVLSHFWEWELGDWKEFRFIRILSIDRGDVSFMDMELHSISEPPSGFKTSILVTYPMDSRSMSRVKEHTLLVRNDINALVFSVQRIVNVTANIFDSWRAFKLVEEIPLMPASGSSNGKPLYHAKWNAENYVSSSATRYCLQVHAIDFKGKQTTNELRPFSVEGKTAGFSSSLLVYLVFDLHWEQVFYVLQWSNLYFLVLLLFLPKLLNIFMERNSSYQKWAMSTSISSSPSFYQRKFLFRLLWFLMEGSRTKKLWYAMIIYLIYLLKMPWFWGYATSEKGNIFELGLSGWRIRTSKGKTTSEWLGMPDSMTITLPFIYFILTPLFVLIYSFSAERSAFFSHSSQNTKCSDNQMNLETENNRTFFQSYCTTGSLGCKFCAGWPRKTLLLAGAVIACLHLKLVSGVMEAYGATPVLLSPAVSWVPCLLLVAAIYSTMK